MKKLFIFISVLCYLLLTACSQRKIPNTSSSSYESERTISETVSYLPSISNFSQQINSSITEQQTPISENSFYLNIPIDKIVKLSFFRMGGNESEIVDTTEDTSVIATIIQTINELEFAKSDISDEEIRMKNGTSSSICIDYQDGSCKILRNQSGWYQYTDYEEQWLNKKSSFDIEQFIADKINVKLWK